METATKTVAPFPPPVAAAQSVQAQTETAKAVQEIQAALVIAKKFPRDEHAAYNRIVAACQRKTFAEQALYAYPRGDELVEGPSIRMAELMAQSWGNLSFGVRELEQRNGESLAQAFAWDMETNTRQVKEFTVPHKRFTKRGSYTLTDPRDIYELVANSGARRMRACILGVIPVDVVDAAVVEVKKTMARDEAPLAERITKMVSAFAQIHVTKEMLEKRLAHNIEATTAHEIVTMLAVYKSIREGFKKVADYFDTGAPPAGDKAAGINDALNGVQQESGDPGAGSPGYPEQE